MLAKAASKRMQSDARIDSAEREQVRPKVNGLVAITITSILLFDVEKCQFLRFNRSFWGDLWHFRVAIAQKLGKICE